VKTKAVNNFEVAEDACDTIDPETLTHLLMLTNLLNRSTRQFLTEWGSSGFGVDDPCSFDQGMLQGIQVCLSLIESTLPHLPGGSAMH
jgi:hypothetical protein